MLFACAFRGVFIKNRLSHDMARLVSVVPLLLQYLLHAIFKTVLATSCLIIDNRGREVPSIICGFTWPIYSSHDLLMI